MKYRYNPRKNKWLEEERGINFEKIIDAIEAGGLLADILHPNQQHYPRQFVLVVYYRKYVYIVPYVKETNNSCFLKTIYPSRKYTRIYAKELHEKNRPI